MDIVQAQPPIIERIQQSDIGQTIRQFYSDFEDAFPGVSTNDIKLTVPDSGINPALRTKLETIISTYEQPIREFLSDGSKRNSDQMGPAHTVKRLLENIHRLLEIGAATRPPLLSFDRPRDGVATQSNKPAEKWVFANTDPNREQFNTLVEQFNNSLASPENSLNVLQQLCELGTLASYDPYRGSDVSFTKEQVAEWRRTIDAATNGAGMTTDKVNEFVRSIPGTNNMDMKVYYLIRHSWPRWKRLRTPIPSEFKQRYESYRLSQDSTTSAGVVHSHL